MRLGVERRLVNEEACTSTNSTLILNVSFVRWRTFLHSTFLFIFEINFISSAWIFVFLIVLDSLHDFTRRNLLVTPSAVGWRSCTESCS